MPAAPLQPPHRGTPTATGFVASLCFTARAPRTHSVTPTSSLPLVAGRGAAGLCIYPEPGTEQPTPPLRRRAPAGCEPAGRRPCGDDCAISRQLWHPSCATQTATARAADRLVEGLPARVAAGQRERLRASADVYSLTLRLLLLLRIPAESLALVCGHPISSRLRRGTRPAGARRRGPLRPGDTAPARQTTRPSCRARRFCAG